MKYLFETLFRKYEKLLKRREVIMYINENIEISFEFAEYFYNKYLGNSRNIKQYNRDFWGSICLTSAYSEDFISKNIDRNWNWILISERRNLSKDFVLKHHKKFLQKDAYENFMKHSKELYDFFYETYISKEISPIDNVLQKDKNIKYYSLPNIFIFEDYDEKYYSLIKYLRLHDYYKKFGKKSLKKFIKKYINYINPKYFEWLYINNKEDEGDEDDGGDEEENEKISKYLIIYGSREQLKNSTIHSITRKLYDKYSDKLPSNFKISSIYDITLSDIMTKYFDKMKEDDFDKYTEKKLTENELEYLVNNQLWNDIYLVDNQSWNDIYPEIEPKYYLNWRKLINNKNISRAFIDKYKNDKRYLWGNIEQMYKTHQFYTMKDYEKDPTINLHIVKNIDANFINQHIDFYYANFNASMIENLTDDIAQILINNKFQIDVIFEDSKIDQLSIEFIWKYKEKFIETDYRFVPKTNEEAIKYFPFCINFNNVDIFNAESNDLVYIFNKWIPIEKVLDLLDQKNDEIGELPRDILTTILEMLTFE